MALLRLAGSCYHGAFQQDPSLLSSGVEEMVRWTSPVIHFARTAAQDIDFHGQKIRKDDVLALFYPSTNRDEEIFDAPDRFRVDRRPNRHLGFGVGEHFCAGAHVARLELEMAYRYLLPGWKRSSWRGRWNACDRT